MYYAVFVVLKRQLKVAVHEVRFDVIQWGLSWQGAILTGHAADKNIYISACCTMRLLIVTVRVDILTWPTVCFTASKMLGCPRLSTTWPTSKNSFQNSSTCLSSCLTTITLILVKILILSTNHTMLPWWNHLWIDFCNFGRIIQALVD